jgi:hypothetical protein
LRLPSEDEVAGAERELGKSFPPDYRRYLLEASDVVFLDLVTMVREAWDLGVPRDWLPFCEDNGDYYCLDGNTVRYWSHNGETDDKWPDLGTWINEVWIGEA